MGKATSVAQGHPPHNDTLSEAPPSPPPREPHHTPGQQEEARAGPCHSARAAPQGPGLRWLAWRQPGGGPRPSPCSLAPPAGVGLPGLRPEREPPPPPLPSPPASSRLTCGRRGFPRSLLRHRYCRRHVPRRSEEERSGGRRERAREKRSLPAWPSLAWPGPAQRRPLPPEDAPGSPACQEEREEKGPRRWLGGSSAAAASSLRRQASLLPASPPASPGGE